LGPSRQKAEAKRREGFVRRLGELLDKESGGDDDHPAALAKKALEAGNDREVNTYPSSEIDKVEALGNESRRGELM